MHLNSCESTRGSQLQCDVTGAHSTSSTTAISLRTIRIELITYYRLPIRQPVFCHISANRRRACTGVRCVFPAAHRQSACDVPSFCMHSPNNAALLTSRCKWHIPSREGELMKSAMCLLVSALCLAGCKQEADQGGAGAPSGTNVSSGGSSTLGQADAGSQVPPVTTGGSVSGGTGSAAGGTSAPGGGGIPSTSGSPRAPEKGGTTPAPNQP